MAQITFTAADLTTTLTIDTPLWGYVSTVKLPLWYSTRANGSIGVFDAGVAYDRHVCKCTFQMNATDTGNTLTFFRDSVLGRGNPVYMSLPSGSGFFPFTPEKGDAGEFIVQVIDVQPSEQLSEPLRWYNVSVALIYISGPTPAYTIPAIADYGNITIGAYAGYRFPEEGFKSEARYAIQARPVFSQYAGIVDLGQSADNWRVKFDLYGTRKAIGRLIYYLRIVNRSPSTKIYQPFTVTTTADQFLFGQDQGDEDSYSCILLSKDLEVSHINYDMCKVPLSLQLVAKL